MLVYYDLRGSQHHVVLVFFLILRYSKKLSSLRYLEGYIYFLKDGRTGESERMLCVFNLFVSHATLVFWFFGYVSCPTFRKDSKRNYFSSKIFFLICWILMVDSLVHYVDHLSCIVKELMV